MADFSTFDRRGYRTVSVKDGYRRWQPTYETTVEDTMDLALLDRISSVDWSALGPAADLGCGTGRTAAWLEAHGATVIDGVDVTPEMLKTARQRGLHRHLSEADVRDSGLPSDAYDLVLCCLVDEHLPDLGPLYAEAARLLTPARSSEPTTPGVPDSTTSSTTGGAFVLVGFHPFFIMASGMPTHFDDADGEPVAVETHIHLLSDHLAAARSAGLTAVELHEAVVDDEWVRLKPTWDRYRDWPVSFAWVWRAFSPA